MRLEFNEETKIATIVPENEEERGYLKTIYPPSKMRKLGRYVIKTILDNKTPEICRQCHEMEITDENKPMSINENKIEASTSRTNIKQMIMSTDSLPVSNMYNTGLGHIQEALPENPYQGL